MSKVKRKNFHDRIATAAFGRDFGFFWLKSPTLRGTCIRGIRIDLK